MKIRPLQDRVLVQRVTEREQTEGGIVIPQSAAEKAQQGTVIAVGMGRREPLRCGCERIPLDVQVGESVLFGKYAGQDVKVDGQAFLIMREDEILAVVE